MKKNLWPLLLMIFCPSGAYPDTVSALVPPVPRSPTEEKFFFKAGAGTYLGQVSFTNFPNRPNMTGLPSNVDTTQGVGGFTGSVALGVDFPDHFSLFASGECLPQCAAFMTNAQYAFAKIDTLQAYLYGGAGLDFYSYSIGPGFQLGLGTDIALAPSFDVFVETKLYFAFGDWSSVANPALNQAWYDGFVPLLTGLKFNL